MLNFTFKLKVRLSSTVFSHGRLFIVHCQLCCAICCVACLVNGVGLVFILLVMLWVSMDLGFIHLFLDLGFLIIGFDISLIFAFVLAREDINWIKIPRLLGWQEWDWSFLKFFLYGWPFFPFPTDVFLATSYYCDYDIIHFHCNLYNLYLFHYIRK